MKNYANKTDPEINFAVAKIVSVDGVVERNDLKNVVLIHDYHNGICLGWKSIDYCNSWADAGPIIVENGICLVSPVKPRDEWIITWSNDGGMWSVNDFTCRHKNPLRAAMIVFLMMKDAEK